MNLMSPDAVFYSENKSYPLADFIELSIEGGKLIITFLTNVEMRYADTKTEIVKGKKITISDEEQVLVSSSTINVNPYDKQSIKSLLDGKVDTELIQRVVELGQHRQELEKSIRKRVSRRQRYIEAAEKRKYNWRKFSKGCSCH